MWKIQTVIDEHTPLVCRVADGAVVEGITTVGLFGLPHATSEGEIDCRCVCVSNLGDVYIPEF